jgi:hypothetical protein
MSVWFAFIATVIASCPAGWLAPSIRQRRKWFEPEFPGAVRDTFPTSLS